MQYDLVISIIDIKVLAYAQCMWNEERYGVDLDQVVRLPTYPSPVYSVTHTRDL